MADGVLLKDQLFNRNTISQLAGEYAPVIPGFVPDRFINDVLGGLPSRELMARLDWIADCLEKHLAADFPTMSAQLLSAMPPPLDPTLKDDDFGRFIHAVPGILAVRHGLETHRDQALDLLKEATKRFSMEFYIRPFLNRWPEEVMERLALWAHDENYHVRRLVSEGTRPKLPWAKAVALTPEQTLPLLDRLVGDPTRYVSRSVANHLNDISKSAPDLVVETLAQWHLENRQEQKELAWITRHALRSLVKQGHSGSLSLLGYNSDAPVDVQISLASEVVEIGAALEFQCDLTSTERVPVLVDYRIHFHRPTGKSGQKVYKLRQSIVEAGDTLTLQKVHKIKGDATTFKLHPGPHRLVLQVNGQDRAVARFELVVPK